MLWLHEKLTILKIRLRKKLQSFHRWGRSYLSFMIIPHSQKHVLKVQLSWYLILFFGVILMATAAGTALIVIHRQEYNTEKLLNETNRQDLLLHNMRWQLVHMNKVARAIYAQTDGLNEIIWPDLDDNRGKNLLSTDDFSDEPPALDSVIRIRQDIQALNRNLRRLKKIYFNPGRMLAERWKVFSLMPQGSPLPDGVGHPTSSFGPRKSPFLFKNKMGFHTGQDLATAEGTPIYATADGIVKSAQAYPSGGLGIYVKIDHEFGFESIYAHCRRIFVHTGQQVKKRQLIGWVGQTGSATGPHVHYEILIGGYHQKPDLYLSPFAEW